MGPEMDLVETSFANSLRDGLGVAPAVGGFPAFLKHPQARGEVGLSPCVCVCVWVRALKVLISANTQNGGFPFGLPLK